MATRTPQEAPKRHQELFAVMCHYDFWDKPVKQAGFESLSSSLKTLNHRSLKKELNEVITLLIARLETQEFSMPVVNNTVVDSSPLKMHVRYPKEHIFVAFGESTIDKKSSSREGVLNIADANTELLFVTLDKCEKQFSATTMYHDYAISPELFHWQTQIVPNQYQEKVSVMYNKNRTTKPLYCLLENKQKMNMEKPWAS